MLTGYAFRKPDGLLEVAMRPAKFRPVGAMGIYHNLVNEGSVRLTACASVPSPPPPPGAPPALPAFDYANKLFVQVSALDIVNIVQSPITAPVRTRPRSSSGWQRRASLTHPRTSFLNARRSA